MKAQSINIENLIPSTLLEEEHSDEETFSNNKSEINSSSGKEAPQNDKKEKVINNIITIPQNVHSIKENENHNHNSKTESNSDNSNDFQKLPKEENHMDDFDELFENLKDAKKEMNFQCKDFFPSNSTKTTESSVINEAEGINSIKRKKMTNGFKNINSKNKINEVWTS